MARTPTLSFDRGTLILHPPPRAKSWIDYAVWDDRVERFRIPALYYRHLVLALQAEGTPLNDEARAFQELPLEPALEMPPYDHQREALAAWFKAKRAGVVVLPTGSGKTYLAQMAIQSTQRSTLVVVPTLDLLHQWYAHLVAAFPDAPVGVLGGGSQDRTPLLVATYDSAAIYAETLGNQYALLVLDECHHLPSDFLRVIAEYSLAPYRLGLTATPERSDGRHLDLGSADRPRSLPRLAPGFVGHGALLAPNCAAQSALVAKRAGALRPAHRHPQRVFAPAGHSPRHPEWLAIVCHCERPFQRRAAVPCWRTAKLAPSRSGPRANCACSADLLAQHHPARTLIFTDDNATVYRISQDFLLPAITHKTPVKERHDILDRFRSGDYPVIVTSRVLNEGVDVPEASIAIVLSGTGSTREYIQRLGRILRRGEGKLADPL